MEVEMSWEAGFLSQKRKLGGPLGLRNLGNSCYLNSVLQCLTYTPPLANFCLRQLHSSLCDSSEFGRKRDCPFCILEKRIVRSLCSDLVLDAPKKIQNCLKIFSEQFQYGEQEDAHEFLRYVIDACHNTCLRLKKLHCIGNGNGNGNGSANGGGESVVKEIFGGALQSQVKCLCCGNESNKVDEIMDISLDILHSSSLKDALRRFFQAEVLDGNNKYRCESCKKLVSARKQMSVLQAPNILVIQFKRFEGVYGGKIDKSISFEEVLVLSSYMCKTSKDPGPEYKLFGTIVHSGFSPDSGHYYAYIKDVMGRWYCCNDSCITNSTVQEVLSEKVYILFFCRTNQRRESANISLANSTTNGVKSRDCYGHEGSKILEPVLSLKAVHPKPYEQKDVINASKAEPDKVASPGAVKFNIVQTSNSKGPSISNGNVFKKQAVTANGTISNGNVFKKQAVTANGTISNGNVFKKGAVTANGNAKGISCSEEEKPKSTISQNGIHNNKKVNGFAVGNSHLGNLSSNGVSDHKHVVDVGIDHVKTPPSKRKLLEDCCTLLAEDAESREKVENLKEMLTKEALSNLRSCGWSEKVYSFMSSKKRLCAQEGRMTPFTRDELRKSLIADSKSTFLSQIPESLKGNLIKQLQSFSQEI